MNPLGLTILGMVLLVVMTGPPSRALLGMVAGVLYLTQSQQIVLGGFNFFAFRIVELAGFIRVISRREFSFSQLTRIDKALILFIVYTVVVFILSGKEGVAYRIGWGVDAFLSYFAFRGMVRNLTELRLFLSSFLLILIPYALLVTFESITRNNLFTLIGGRTGGADMIREGRLRAIGSFRHPSLMGTLGATFIPLYLGLALGAQNRMRAFYGIAACAAIIWASNSGGPASGGIVAFAGWLIWKLRAKMRFVRIGAVLSVIFLGLIMKAPIWYLIAKVSSITGGDGWHRSKLMERAFESLGEWWLSGMPHENTRDWFPYYIHGTGGADITNQFIVYAIAAGLGSMALFIYVLVQSYKTIGAAIDHNRSNTIFAPSNEYLLWGLGVMLAVHMFNWIGIGYFDQTYALWYLQLAMISCSDAKTYSIEAERTS